VDVVEVGVVLRLVVLLEAVVVQDKAHLQVVVV
jgi:hypothetical protein